MIRTITSASLLAFTLGGAFGQSAPERPAFEVASVKPNQSGDRGMSFGRPPGRFTATNVTLKLLITYAYGVSDHQISGGPSWLNSERYDIVAKEPADDPSVARTMPMLHENPGVAKTMLMLQTLLSDRFQLRLLRETKELPGYALVVAKNGHKLHEGEGTGNGMRIGRGRITTQAISMDNFSKNLGRLPGRPVVDRTALKGKFAFTLEWTPDPSQPTGLLGPSPAPVDDSGPSIFTALQEQLGLKLEPQKGPVEILVIDHVEKPSEN